MNGQSSPGYVCACVLALLAWATATQAKTVYVDPDGKGDFISISTAIAAAKSGDIIVLRPGTFAGEGNVNVSLTGKAVTLCSQDPNDPNTVARTIIDCQGTKLRSVHALDIVGPGTSLELLGLTIRNGYDFVSGTVQCKQADLTVKNCTFLNNTTEGWGTVVETEDSHARFEGCTFSNNVSQSGHGGAIYAKGSQLDFVNCTFEGNTGSSIETYDCQVTLADSEFRHNTGKEGAAVYSRADTDPASTSLAVARCIFTGNAATANGGALYNYGLAATIATSTFTMNTSDKDGGAVYNFRASPRMADCVFSGNTATVEGGAVQNLYNSSPTIVNCTFVTNGAENGGAVAARGGGNLLLSHNILWNNTATQGTNLYLGRYAWSSTPTAAATIEYCDVKDGQDCAYAESGCNVRWGLGNIEADPLFTDATKDDYHLDYNSPCMDAGDPKYMPEASETDRDGRSRRIGSAVDLGAYELPGIGAVYRFWSPTKNKHFYTIRESERDKLISRYSNIWQYEGVSYCAFYQPVEASLVPVYRFWSPKLESHFWTTSETEREKTIREFSDVWIDEGIAFYAYGPGSQPLGALPVYRFWSNRMGDHFYTMSEDEKNKLIRDYSRDWQFEGVAWYAYANLSQPMAGAYNFTGGPQEASFILTLRAMVDGKEAQIASPDVRLSTSSTWMQMTIDFQGLSTTLDRLQVLTKTTDYTGTISQDGSAVKIPVSLSVQAQFDVATPVGPFAVDPETGAFADGHGSTSSPGPLPKERVAKYGGSVTLGSQVRTFDLQTTAIRVAPDGVGTFEGLELLPDQIYARLPYTFQWQREDVNTLLAEASVNGHLVQLYVSSVYVGTQGLWKGRVAE